MKYYSLQCIFKETKVLLSSCLENKIRSGSLGILQLCQVVFQEDSSMCSLLIKVKIYYQLIKVASHLVILLFKINFFCALKKSEISITSTKLILILSLQQKPSKR